MPVERTSALTDNTYPGIVTYCDRAPESAAFIAPCSVKLAHDGRDKARYHRLFSVPTVQTPGELFWKFSGRILSKRRLHGCCPSLLPVMVRITARSNAPLMPRWLQRFVNYKKAELCCIGTRRVKVLHF